jgi:hypothetical protein
MLQEELHQQVGTRQEEMDKHQEEEDTHQEEDRHREEVVHQHKIEVVVVACLACYF